MNRQRRNNCASGKYRFNGSRLIIAIAAIMFVSSKFFTASAARPAFFAPPVVIQAFSVTGGTPSPTDNDYTRINNAVQSATTGTTIELQGTFNWTETNAAASWALGSDGTAGN